MSKVWKWLQFFADGASGGDGGDGAGTGVTSADAGQSAGVTTDDAGQRLEKLGVPKEKAERFRKSMERRGAKPPEAPDEPPADGVEAVKEPRDEKKRDVKKEVDDFLADPEHQKYVQSIIAERGKKATEASNQATETMRKIDPLVQLFAKHYKIEAKDGNVDIDAIVKAATEDDYFFEDEALEKGESVEKVKSDWQQEREEAQRQEEERRRVLDERFHSMLQQTPAIQQEYPGFDLNAELMHPEFVNMTLPTEYGGLGWDARRAYRALHQDDLEKAQVDAIAERALADAARARSANQARPRENGSSSAAVSMKQDPYALMRSMTHKERLAYIKNLR